MNIYTIQILIKLKNASLVKKENLLLHYSIQSACIIKLLYKLYVVQSFFFNKKTNTIQIFFKLYLNKILFEHLHFISKPSQDTFITFKNLCRLQLQPKTSFVVSTDNGLILDQNCKKFKKGGKLLFVY